MVPSTAHTAVCAPRRSIPMPCHGLFAPCQAVSCPAISHPTVPSHALVTAPRAPPISHAPSHGLTPPPPAVVRLRDDAPHPCTTAPCCRHPPWAAIIPPFTTTSHPHPPTMMPRAVATPPCASTPPPCASTRPPRALAMSFGALWRPARPPCASANGAVWAHGTAPPLHSLTVVHRLARLVPLHAIFTLRRDVVACPTLLTPPSPPQRHIFVARGPVPPLPASHFCHTCTPRCLVLQQHCLMPLRA
ncbi:hypothetical protein DENSPDRAFT_885411 [Dentipellis sp. KUC8613]|nr:hypothetical protein DENSPDRAFT_885411 [Dentipellis sp. KUC8613]